MKFTTARAREKQLLACVNPENLYRTRVKTCMAVLEPYDGEIRIPFVARNTKGDFKALMDELVVELDCQNVRFIATQKKEHPLRRMVDALGPEDARDLEDAVHGFETEWVDDYEHPIDTLVGVWEPENDG